MSNNRPELLNVPLSFDIAFEVPIADYVERIQSRIDTQLEADFPAVAEQVRQEVGLRLREASSSEKIALLVQARVDAIVNAAVNEAVSKEVVIQSARSALKKATAEAVARVLGHTP